jgi:hypothetical protein
VNRAAVPFFAWAALLTVLAVVLWAWTSDDLPPAVFGAAAAIVWVAGLVALFVRRRRPGARPAPDLSLASAFVAFAVAALVLGALVGRWLVYLGAGLLLIGLVGVARELRAQRRAR